MLHPPYLFSCLLSRFDCLDFRFSVVIIFLFSPICNSPSVRRFNSSSSDVVIGRHPSLSEVSWFSKSLSSFSFSPSSLSVSVSVFLFSVQYIPQDSIPLDVLSVNCSQAVTIFWKDFVSDLRCPFCFSRSFFGARLLRSPFCCSFFLKLPASTFLI